MKSFHSYLRPFRLPRRRRRERRVYALTEYGGYSLKVPGHDWSTREFGYRHFESAEGLADGFVALHRELSAVFASGALGTVEFLFVDDGSRDGSWEIISDLARSDPRVSAIRLRRNWRALP